MMGRDDRLCYLDASKLVSSVGTLSHVDLRGADDRLLGVLDGVVIDPTERRVRYFVVESAGWLRRKRFLLPADATARVESDLGELRLEVNSDDLSRCEEFRAGSVRDFDDDDLIAGVFHQRQQ
jgi:hypothetical protein